MFPSNKKDYNSRMQVADSVRYREAVMRLKRILYERPPGGALLAGRSPERDRKAYSEAYATKDEEHEREIADRAILDTNQKSMASLFDMVKRQDDLIAHLEKETLFLKNELMSTAEASKEIALQNESFRKRLTDTLVQMEKSPDISSYSEGEEKSNEIIKCLKEEREKLVDCIRIQEETIATLRHREIEATDKVKQAVSLAEDNQQLTDKARESGERNRRDLQQHLEDALDKIQLLQKQLQKCHEKEREQEQILRDQEKILTKLEEERRNKDLSLKKKEFDSINQIEDLRRSLKKAEEGKERLEKLLHEQRNTSEATFQRLESLLDRRNSEAEAFGSRKRALEKQILDQKQENQRLLQVLNELSKDRSTYKDDTRSLRQKTSLLPDDINAKQEMKDIKATVQQHQESITNLQKEVSVVRQEMTQGMDGLRLNIEELCSSLHKEDNIQDKKSTDEDATLNNSNNRNDSIKIDPIVSSSRSEGYESLKEGYEGALSSDNLQPHGLRQLNDNNKGIKVLSIPQSPNFGKVKETEEVEEKTEGALAENNNNLQKNSDNPISREREDQENKTEKTNNEQQKENNENTNEKNTENFEHESDISTPCEPSLEISAKERNDQDEKDLCEDEQEIQSTDEMKNCLQEKNYPNLNAEELNSHKEFSSETNNIDTNNDAKENYHSQEIISNLEDENKLSPRDTEIEEKLLTHNAEESAEHIGDSESEKIINNEKDDSKEKEEDNCENTKNHQIPDENEDSLIEKTTDSQNDSDIEPTDKTEEITTPLKSTNHGEAESSSELAVQDDSPSVDHGDAKEGENTDADSKVTLPLEAVVSIVGEEMEGIKKTVELQSQRLDNITEKVLTLAEAENPPETEPSSDDKESEDKDIEKSNNESQE